MSDILGKLASFLLGAVILFIVPVMLIAIKQDDTKQTVIDDAVIEFVDNARASGQITPFAYQTMCKKISSVQETCKVDMTYESAISYSVPVDETGARIPTDNMGNVASSYTGTVFYQTQTSSETYDKQDILNRMYNKINANGDPIFPLQSADDPRPFDMREGGYLAVTVQNTAPTMGTKFVRLFIPFYTGRSLLSSYSGYVGNTRQK